jgi:ubiquinone/menaquinone biosynthesis C-methylase UbiE
MSIIERNIPVGSNILEISCGNGSDAEYLKNNGYNIICTELDDSYIDNVKSKGIECIKQNTKDKFPFQDGQFDLVYSRLGLHYFTEDELDSIFKELSRISDKVLITVKIEDDEFKTGKIILTPDKWFEIINKYFNIEVFDIKQGLLYGKPSKWLEVFAK